MIERVEDKDEAVIKTVMKNSNVRKEISLYDWMQKKSSELNTHVKIMTGLAFLNQKIEIN